METANTKNTIDASTEISTQIRKSGIETWEALTQYIRNLPYGRNANRMDCTLVWKEQKGTCSSKHAFLKTIADENQLSDVKLIIGLYKMNEKNTPKIGSALSDNGIEYIPEAHCYLKVNNERIDFTNPQSDIQKISSDIIEEQSIQPEQVSEYKVTYHKNYLKNWLTQLPQNNLSLTFEQLWKIREQCIQNLSN